jgi:hypothetical protein
LEVSKKEVTSVSDNYIDTYRAPVYEPDNSATVLEVLTLMSILCKLDFYEKNVFCFVNDTNPMACPINILRLSYVDHQGCTINESYHEPSF